jgi:hypothetical protein
MVGVAAIGDAWLYGTPRWVLAQTRQEACDRLETTVMRPSGTRENKQTNKQYIMFFININYLIFRDFLQGEGDITKHLGYLGYEVKHKQTSLDEFDFAVTNVATDLKSGVRLTRVLEILTHQTLTTKLRLPVISRLQSVHNVDLALTALGKSEAGMPPTMAITSR